MAKYLDELGLSTLWAKIKGTFVKNIPGRGLKALTGNQATTHEGTWIQDSSWSSTDSNTNPYRFIINYPIHVAPGETVTITGFINDAAGFDSSKAVIYSATAPKQPMGEGSGSHTWTNNSSTTTAVILGYLSDDPRVATKVGLKYTLGVNYGDYTILALDQATDTKLGGVTLTDYVSAHTNSGVESGIAVTPKAVAQAINNANGILEIDDIITGNPTVQTTTAPSGGTIVYNSTTEKFLYAVTNGSTTTYYNNGGDLSNYGGTKDNNGVSPTEGKIYIKDNYIYIWNGEDLVKVNGDITVDGVFGNTINRFGVCSTPATTAAKTVTITSGEITTLTTGTRITVKFDNPNTADNPTLNVNNTGAKPILYNTNSIYINGNDKLLRGTLDFVYVADAYPQGGWILVEPYYATKATANDAATAGLITSNMVGDLYETYNRKGFSTVKVGSSTTTANLAQDTLVVAPSNKITASVSSTASGSDVINTLTIGLGAADTTTVGGLKASSPEDYTGTDVDNDELIQYGVQIANNSTAFVKIPFATSGDESQQLYGVDGLMTSNQVRQLTSNTSDIEVLKSTVSAAFQYTVRTALPTSIGTGTNAPNQRPADPASLATEIYARMKVIYLVPIINTHDADSNNPNASDHGDYQTYAEYVLVNGTGTATNAIGPDKKYTWERLGTTDVNIDAITTNYINNLT